MELRQLRCFVAVATVLHFRKAADQLAMTQPPLSQTIKSLEDEVGVQLIERGRRTRVRLTPAGQAFLSAAQRILEEAENAKRTAILIDKGSFGSISIGYSDDFVYGSLPTILHEMSVRHPGILLCAYQGTSFRLADRLLRAEVDCILTTQPIQAALANCNVSSWPASPIVAVVKSDHRHANREEIALQELSGERLVVGSKSNRTSFDAQVNKLMINANVEPIDTIESLSSAMSIEMVSRGYGVSLASLDSIPTNQPGIKILMLSDENASLERAIVWRNENYNPAVKSFIDICTEFKR